MKTDEEIIDAMILQDEKDAIRQEMLQDKLHERLMRADIDYFLKNSSFEVFNEAYNKFLKELRHYDWDGTTNQRSS